MGDTGKTRRLGLTSGGISFGTPHAIGEIPPKPDWPLPCGLPIKNTECISEPSRVSRLMFVSMSTTNISRSPNAVRVARHYQRRKLNRAIMSVEVDWVALAAMLIHAKFLPAWDAQ